ncbi:hypothetical protein GJ849_03280 [Salmonella enterica]|nr:hypothetical protein [Salmonella enterica subsp. enterica serovar Goverdhan]EDE8830999.1 hypothetical protein [Salmonella enterica subsp. enterica serovar Goverdhan]EDT8794868.1 hypothetical protein [Salmonella enterica subsp. enterica]EEM7368379.1 hypothetical protein [Salmonella enterica]
MPVFSTPDEYNNGYVPSGNVLPAPTGFDVPPPKGTNPPPEMVVSDTSHIDMLFSPSGGYGLPLLIFSLVVVFILLKIRK